MTGRTLAAAALAAAFSISSAGAQLWDARDLFLPRPPEEPDAGTDEFGGAVASCDYDEDGYDDLAVGWPAYGSGDGAVSFLRAHPAGGFRQAVTYLGSDGERLGEAIVCGHFHGDATWQVAVGGPGFLQDGIREGRVRLFNWVAGSTSDGVLQQSLAGVVGAPEEGDEFGAALAAGDWNGDGVDDLAVGSPGEAIGVLDDAGAVTFFYGVETSGIGIEGNTIWHKDIAGVGGDPAAGERLGEALAAFDANCDGFDDLAIGVPSQTVAGVSEAGTVYAVVGSNDGLVPAELVILDTTSFTQPGTEVPTDGDRFGAVLASVGDYFNDGCGGLAIAAPDREVDGHDDAGAIYIRRLHIATSRYYTRLAVGPSAGTGDHFGSAFATGDWDHDGRGDLAIGVRGNDPLLTDLTGGIYVMLSLGNEPDPDNAYLIQPRPTLAMSEGLVDDGALGAALATGDFDGDGWDDLASGTPNGDDSEAVNRGGVEVLFGALFAADFEGGNAGEWAQ